MAKYQSSEHDWALLRADDDKAFSLSSFTTPVMTERQIALKERSSSAMSG